MFGHSSLPVLLGERLSVGGVACAMTVVNRSIPIAHFQNEWQTGERMGARSIMGSFGGTIARVKIFRSRKSTCTETETLKILKQKGKKVPKGLCFCVTTFRLCFQPFCF